MRVIAATNRDLWCEVLAGRFREDLYHRLNVLYIKRPANASKDNDIAYTAVWHPGKPVQGFFDRQLLSIYQMAVNLLGGNHSEVARFPGMDRKTLLCWVDRAERRAYN